MTTGSYYESLDSFLDAKKKNKYFAIHVTTKSGETLASSNMPIAFLSAVTVALEASEAAHVAISVWDRTHNKLLLVPHHNVAYISVVFID